LLKTFRWVVCKEETKKVANEAREVKEIIQTHVHAFKILIFPIVSRGVYETIRQLGLVVYGANSQLDALLIILVQLTIVYNC
jgi:hypothetical protein